MQTKKEKILETAMKLFVENGIQSTATASIAKEAGVATGTLFHHFKSKEDLVHELYNSIFYSLLSYQKEHFHETNDTYERLRQIWRLYKEWGTSHVEYAHFLERYSFFYYASESVIDETYEHFEYCEKTFEEAVAKNLMKINDLEYIRNHYIWNIRMNIIYFINQPEQCTPENIEKTFTIYWTGIANV